MFNFLKDPLREIEEPYFSLDEVCISRSKEGPFACTRKVAALTVNKMQLVFGMNKSVFLEF